MHKQKVLISILLCLFCAVGFRSYGQITSDVVHGCSPLNVHFTGTSGANLASESWSLGVNNVVAGGHTPSNIYVAPGTYNITYTATVAGSPVSYSLQITVYPNPTASFTYVLPPSHCNPMSVSFTASGGVAGSTYYWVYGDLSTSSGTAGATVHPYNMQGIFSPTLTVTDAVTGCNGTVTLGAIIPVSNPPNMIIASNPGLSACTAPFITSFSSAGSSSGSPYTGVLTYNWTFGNGTPASTQANPSNISYGQGQFQVTLTGTDDNHCAGTAHAQVTVNQPSLSATVPGTVCLNDAFTVTAQSSQTSLSWSMGDGSVEQYTLGAPGVPVTNTVHIYTTPGLQHVVISALLSGCSATHAATIFVEDVTANFSASQPSISCGPSLTVNYHNLSTSNTSVALNYTWTPTWIPNEYDATTYSVSYAQNPSFTYYQSSPNPYTIYGIFVPEVYLFVQSTSIAQCTAIIAMGTNTLQRPTAWFNTNKNDGCAPLAVTFRDSSFILPGSTIVHYSWNNGANPPTIVTGSVIPIPPQTFTYTSPGTYTPYFIIQTSQGCIDTSFIDTIRVANPPTVSALFSPSIVCAGQPVQFSLTAAPTQSAIEHWHVTTDNGFFSGCVTNPNPAFPFTHVGVQSITVSAYQNGCEGSSVSTQSITVNGPIGKTRFEVNCAAPKVVKFYSLLQDVQTATLSFGDNTFSVIAGSTGTTSSSTLSHTYAVGDYTATLSSVNGLNTCPVYTYTMAVHVRDVHALISLPAFPASTAIALACVNNTIAFSSAGSTDAVTGCQRGYIWNFNASNPLASTIPAVDTETPGIVQAFSTPGIYTVSLLVKDINGCTNTDTRQFRISDVNPLFAFNVNPICLSDTFAVMTNNTATSTLMPDVVTHYLWSFGDGTQLNTTTTATQTHGYTAANPPFTTYVVTLTATNTAACVNQVTHVLRVNNPYAHFVGQTFACIPQAITFSCSPVYQTYKISYADSLYSLTTNAQLSAFKHTYTTVGDFSVNLTVTDTGGCSNSFSSIVIARVTPVASFTTVGNANLCVPANITFSSTSTTTDPSHPLFITWDVGAGPVQTNSTIATNVFITPGTTTITLMVAAINGGLCASTASSTIYVYDTHATLVLNRTRFCVGDTVIAHLTNTQDAQDWICNVGFGIQPSLTPVLTTQSLAHTYTNSAETGTAYVLATVTSPFNACTISTNSVNIEIIKLNPDFKRNLELSVADSAHCIKIPDKFTHAPNTTTAAVSYNWDFGNGSTTTSPDPDYIFPTPGIWPVHLTASVTSLGCPISVIKNMTISPQPTATLLANDNCPGSTFIINANGSQGIVSGTWTPAQNMVSPPVFTISSPGTFSAAATATISTTFSLSVTDYIGCVSEPVSKNVLIQQPANQLNLDTVIVIGQNVPIDLFAGDGFTYSWTPVVAGLSCVDCYNPVASSTVNITYTVIITDQLGCSAVSNTYKIIIEPKSSLDVPTAFTPNGDGVNDIVYASGWGIKKLNYFRIFNRWGELLFESTDVKIGWNGFFNGIPQNMETYVYQVSAETYIDDKPILKTGTVKIIR
jgi:gliding motility-associated-like protein